MISKTNWTGSNKDWQILENMKYRFSNGPKEALQTDPSTGFLTLHEANFISEVFTKKGYTTPFEMVAKPIPSLSLLYKFFYGSGFMFLIYFLVSFYFSFYAFGEIKSSGGFMSMGLSPIIGVPILFFASLLFASAAMPPMDMMMVNYIDIEGVDSKPSKKANLLVGLSALGAVTLSFGILYFVGKFLLQVLLPVLAS